MPVFIHFAMLFLMGILGAGRTAGSPIAGPPGDHEAANEALAGEGEMTSYQEQIFLSQLPHGCDRHEIRGQLCADGYTRGFTAAMMSGSGLCMVEGWASDDPKDCRVRVHLVQGPLQSGTCVVTVYETPM